MGGFDPDRLARLGDVMRGHVERDSVAGVAWLAARDDDVEVGCAGTLSRGADQPVRRDSIFRISSMTKPIVAVAALTLVEDCRLRLDDPVDELLPSSPTGVCWSSPVARSTARRSRRSGRSPCATSSRSSSAGAWTSRPGGRSHSSRRWASWAWAGDHPSRRRRPSPTSGCAALATLPLLYQPGERWLYNTGSDVLGVLVARAAGQPLDVLLRERVLEPLGMVDTGFATSHLDRLGSCYATDPETGAKVVYDAPDGQWAKPPAFPSGAGGLVSTVDDVHAFARMLLAGGRLPNGSPLLSAASVEAMTTDQIGIDRGGSGPSPDGAQGGDSVSGSRCAAPASPAPSAATGGTAGSARPGPTIPGSGSWASC